MCINISISYTYVSLVKVSSRVALLLATLSDIECFDFRNSIPVVKTQALGDGQS